MTNFNQSRLPKVLAGPIVRQVHAEQICFWLVTKAKYDLLEKKALEDIKLEKRAAQEALARKAEFENETTEGE